MIQSSEKRFGRREEETERERRGVLYFWRALFVGGSFLCSPTVEATKQHATIILMQSGVRISDGVRIIPTRYCLRLPVPSPSYLRVGHLLFSFFFLIVFFLFSGEWVKIKL